jgi:hypothetical protein
MSHEFLTNKFEMDSFGLSTRNAIVDSSSGSLRLGVGQAANACRIASWKDQLLLVKLDQSTVLFWLWSVGRIATDSTLPDRLSTPVLRGERLELVEAVFCLPITLPTLQTVFRCDTRLVALFMDIFDSVLEDNCGD